MKTKNLLFILVILSGILSTNPVISQNPGDLYTDFGEDGIGIWDWLDKDEFVYDMVVQDDDKIVVVGEIDYGTTSDILVVRFNADGTPDLGFGQINGAMAIDLSDDERANAVTLYPSGNIIVAGNTGDNCFVMKLNQDGSLDESFGLDGILEFYPASGIKSLEDVSIQYDVKIVLAGWGMMETKRRGCVARLTAEGNVDEEFGDNGYVWTEEPDINLDYSNIVVQENDKILVSGKYLLDNSNLNIIVSKLNPEGAYDDSFGYSGMLLLGTEEEDEYVNSISLDNDKIILACQTYMDDSRSVSNIKLYRLLSNGAYDSTFNDGIAMYDIGTEDNESVFAACIQVDGKYVIAGRTDGDLMTMRVKNNSDLDMDFGGEGFVLTDIAGESDVNFGTGTQSDMNIITAGFCLNSDENFDIVVTKYYSGLYVGKYEKDIMLNELSIFPNPATNHLNINLEGINSNVLVSFYTLSGKKVYEEKKSTTENDFIEITDLSLASGLYFIKIITKYESYTSKLIIEK